MGVSEARGLSVCVCVAECRCCVWLGEEGGQVPWQCWMWLRAEWGRGGRRSLDNMRDLPKKNERIHVLGHATAAAPRTPSSPIPRVAKVSSGAPKATSGRGGEIFSVSAECQFLYLLAPPISNSNSLKCTACSAFRSLPCNGQLAPKTTDRTETSLRVRGGRGAWERGNLSWKSGVSRDIENGTH